MKNNNEYKVINMKYEYPGFVGNSKWAVISDLNMEELSRRFGNELEKYCPFVLMTVAQGEVMQEYERNEHKHGMRRVRSFDAFAYEEGITELFHDELIVDDLVGRVEAKFERERIRAALETLTSIQKKRVIQYFFCGMSEREIADLEGVNRRAIADSLAAALKKLRKIL